MPLDAADGAGDAVDRDTVKAGADQDDVPAELETDCASSDPGVPSDDLPIVSPELRRGCRWCTFDWHRSVKFLQFIVACHVIMFLLLAIWAGYPSSLELVVPAPVSRPCTEKTPRVCDRPGCVLRAAETLLYLNRSVDPCSNFYSYACGGFHAAHPTGTPRPLGVRQLLEQRNRERLLALLREDQYLNTSSSSALNKAKIFFETCMSSYELGDNSVMSFVDLLDQLGGLELFGTWTIKRRKARVMEIQSDSEETQFDFNDMLSNASLLHPEQGFFELRFDRQLGLLVLDLPRLVLGFVKVITRPGTVVHDQLMSHVRVVMRVFLARLEIDSHGGKPRSWHTSCVDTMIEDVLAVQDALSVLQLDPAVEKTAARQRLTLSQLDELVPQIDWRRLLDQRYGEGVVPDTVTVQVPSSDYMAGVGRIIEDTPYQRLHHFLVWHVIRSCMVGLGTFYAALGEQMDYQFGLKPLKSRKQQCLALLERHMQPALHGLLLARHIDERSLPLVRELVKHAGGTLVDSFALMTERSHRLARDFLDNISVDLGDAPSLLGPLDDYFSPLQFSSGYTDFFHNLRELYRFTPPAQIAQSPLFGSWLPGSTAIGYGTELKTLTVPRGALQRPWFDADVPPPLNAAALGSIVYDALAGFFFMMHIALSETLQWDKGPGCVEDVIKTQPVHQHYLMPLGDSTPRQFMNFTVTSGPLLTAFMLSRDHFSLQLSHRLFSQLAEREPDVTLPGLQVNSSDQMFYLAYAQARCHSGGPEEEEVPVLGEVPRLPREIVVNSIVYSDPAFRAAFQCGSRQPAEGVYRDISACELFRWPAVDASGTPDTTAAPER